MPLQSLTFYSAVSCLLLLLGGQALAAEVVSSSKLTLSRALEIALRIDPMLAMSQAKETAFREKAVAAYSWPDPKLQVGMMNLPTDTFAIDQEPMTQMVIGVAQAFPPAGTVTAMRDKFSEMAQEAGHTSRDNELKTTQGVRLTWLNVYYQFHASQLVKKSLGVFEQYTEVARFQYRAGRGKQQDVIRSQLEYSRLEDKVISFQEQWEAGLADLYKWTGREIIGQEMDMSFPKLPALPRSQELKAGLVSHPAIEAGQSRVDASGNEVKLADARFNPGWMLDLKYGYRGADPKGNDRADFISAMVMVDLPFFTGKRQGRELLASKSMLEASKNSLDDLRRNYQQQFDINLAAFNRAEERLELYSSRLLPQAEQNTEATLNAYQSGVTSFNDLARSQLTELDSQLQYLKLQVDQARAQVRLLYIAGG